MLRNAGRAIPPLRQRCHAPAVFECRRVGELFVSRPFRCYPVVNESRLVGQLSRRNILKALEKLW